MSSKKIWGSLHPFYESGAALGRRVANQRFLEALLRADPYDAYHFFLASPEAVAEMAERLAAGFPDIQGRGGFEVRLHSSLLTALSQRVYHCFHLSDCFTLYSALLQARNACSRNFFPVTAPTHTLSYSNYGQGFLQHLWPGTSRRDAVLATSRAGEAVVNNMYALLRRGYGLDAAEFHAPQVRVAPLGVEPADMPAPEERPVLGADKRRELGISPDETVFLVFARISYLSKMDLLPLLRAFKRAEERGLAAGSYRLLLAGWQDESDAYGEDVMRLASNLGIRHSLALRPDDDARKALYAAADVFLSPSDNLQETFGLTMLEAAAASLPVIASDFDGYRDLVLPGETGYLIPTIGPESAEATGVGASLSASGEYHLRLAQQCVVELGPMAEAMAELAADPALRARMGAKARERALGLYAWDKIIARNVAIWEELAGLPITASEERKLRQAVHPSAVNYMEVFGGYFSARLGGETTGNRLVRWSKAGEAVYRGRDFPVIYQLIEDELPPDELKKLLFAARNPIELAKLAAKFAVPPLPESGFTGENGAAENAVRAAGRFSDRDFLVLWALKHDLLEFF